MFKSHRKSLQILLHAICGLVVSGGIIGQAGADVVVVTNRSRQDVTLTVAPRDRKIAVPSGDVVPLPCRGGLNVSFQSGNRRRSYQLDPNAIYFFGETRDGGLELNRIGLAADSAAKGLPPLAPTQPGTGELAEPPVVIIPVKILVDEEEPLKRELWEKRLRDRVQAASDIIERHCFVRFQVVAVDTWQTDNQINDFDGSLREFEQKVSPGSARIAIGFTSQYQMPKGRHNLGGTRGPFDTHILLREWSKHASESERLELLLHELGHVVGAVHSAEVDSVMRPVLADKKARARSFRIHFDPLNTLAMCLFAEALHANPNAKMSDFDSGTLAELAKLYAEIAKTLPDDPAAGHYLKLVNGAQLAPVAVGSQLVLRMIVATAEQNRELPDAATVPAGTRHRLTGDELGELYVRNGALLAQRMMPVERARQSYLLGLAIALDSSDTMRNHPLAGPACARLESDRDRLHRLAVLGQPTARGREDLLQHFTVSAGLAAFLSPLAAESVGLLKEQSDSNGGSGFSLVDYQADLAGIAFAKGVLAGERPLDKLQQFAWKSVLPDQEGLVEGLTKEAFAQQYGSLFDPRFLSERAKISERINKLAAPGGLAQP